MGLGFRTGSVGHSPKHGEGSVEEVERVFGEVVLEVAPCSCGLDLDADLAGTAGSDIPALEASTALAS